MHDRPSDVAIGAALVLGIDAICLAKEQVRSDIIALQSTCSEYHRERALLALSQLTREAEKLAHTVRGLSLSVPGA